MRIKWTKDMLKAKIKNLELEVKEWKQQAHIHEEMLIMERTAREYVKTKEFEKVKEAE